MSVAVAGELEALGFDEVEPGLVEDTMANRRRIKLLEDGNWDWERVVEEDGELTNLIRVLRPEVVTERRIEVARRRAPILKDPGNHWSDYVHPDEYPLDLDLPYWVDLRLQKWKADGEAGITEDERRPFPTRCAQLRMDGTRCWLWVNKPKETDKCAQHSRLTREALERHPAYARLRILEASTSAVDQLILLMERAEGEAVRLKASTEILDRAGVRGGVEVDINAEVTHVDPGTALQDRLQKLAKRHAEQITEEPDGPPPPALEPAEVVEAEIIEETA